MSCDNEPHNYQFRLKEKDNSQTKQIDVLVHEWAKFNTIIKFINKINEFVK